MAGAAGVLHGAADHAARFESKAATREPGLVKWTILALSLSFFAVFLLLPLVAVFVEALRKGWETYIAALVEPDAVAATPTSTSRPWRWCAAPPPAASWRPSAPAASTSAGR